MRNPNLVRRCNQPLFHAAPLFMLGCCLCALSACSSSNNEAAAPTGCAAPAQTSADFPSALAGQLQTAVAANFDDSGAPGLAALVVLPDGRSWHAAVGLADAEKDLAMTTAARFRVGSVTKTFTSAIVLQLATSGVLSLDESFDAWVPGWSLGEEITIRRLLDHSSGIANYTDHPSFFTRINDPVSPEEVVKLALEIEPKHPPGSGFTYSNTNYFLLAWILEKLDQRAYHDVVRDRLLNEVGVPAIYLEGYEPGECPPVRGHFSGSPTLIDNVDLSWVWAAGAHVATLSDQCVWMRALVFGDGVLASQERTAMQQPTTWSVDFGEPYGLGLQMRERGERYVYGHIGNTVGFHGSVFVDRQTGACVAVGTNDLNADYQAVDVPLWEHVDSYLGN